MKLEIFSDVVCPWCYIGKHRFDQAVRNLTQASIDLKLEILYRPFQLDPTAPIDRPTPVRDVFIKKFGGVEPADEILAHVTKIAAQDGIEFHMDRALRANTSRAHRLIALAQKLNENHTQLKERLMIAYFCEGRDISNIDTLTEIAVECKIDRDVVLRMFADDSGIDELEQNLQRASDLGITAVPTYVFDEKWSVPGAQDTEQFERILRRLSEQTQN